MSFEISEYPSSAFTDYEADEPFFSIPLSLPVDPLSIDPLHGVQAPSAPLLQRLTAAAGLVFFQLLTFSIQLWSWGVEWIRGPCEERMLYKELYQLAQTNNLDQIEQFLTLRAEEFHGAAYILKELFTLPELYPYLIDILQGANVQLVGDNGQFYNRLLAHPKSHPRISSHKYQNKHCAELGYLLFWIDLEGNTRFQLEKNPLKNLRSTIHHICDYLRYKRDNQQQGIVGSSRYTESHCLSISMPL